MDPIEVAAARLAWAHAQLDLDTYLTTVLPAALVPLQQGSSSEPALGDDQAHEIGRLYGRVVGLWARYRELERILVSPGG